MHNDLSHHTRNICHLGEMVACPDHYDLLVTKVLAELYQWNVQLLHESHWYFCKQMRVICVALLTEICISVTRMLSKGYFLCWHLALIKPQTPNPVLGTGNLNKTRLFFFHTFLSYRCLEVLSPSLLPTNEVPIHTVNQEILLVIEAKLNNWTITLFFKNTNVYRDYKNTKCFWYRVV